MTAITLGVQDPLQFSRKASTRWRPAVDRTHRILTTMALGGAAIAMLTCPEGAGMLSRSSGAVLLVGGALIGMPHGSSDFVVAHRLLHRLLGQAWLPTFLAVYLLIVATVMIGWLVTPLATLLVFVLLSCLHFGHGDLGSEERRDGLSIAVRATTPLLPVLLVYSAGVVPLIRILTGVPEISISAALADLQWFLVPWAVAVISYVLRPISARLRGCGASTSSADALEVGAIALAAVTLPPLFAFALYFCLVHAVRHLVGIADEYAPRDARLAGILVAAVILPSAAVCLVVLALAWDSVGGVLGTMEMLAWSLRLIAALTVPHMALDAWAEWSSRLDRECQAAGERMHQNI